jgi:hypothetical protein
VSLRSGQRFPPSLHLAAQTVEPLPSDCRPEPPSSGPGEFMVTTTPRQVRFSKERRSHRRTRTGPCPSGSSLAAPPMASSPVARGRSTRRRALPATPVLVAGECSRPTCASWLSLPARRRELIRRTLTPLPSRRTVQVTRSSPTSCAHERDRPSTPDRVRGRPSFLQNSDTPSAVAGGV